MELQNSKDKPVNISKPNQSSSSISCYFRSNKKGYVENNNHVSLTA
jgi:hypothetical protein